MLVLIPHYHLSLTHYSQKLVVAKIALPLSSYNADLQFAMHKKLISQHKVQNKGLTVIAYDTSNKFLVFTLQLKVDAGLAAFAFLCVFVLIRLHTGSMFITCLAYLEIMSALGVAYFLYMIVLNLPFFPFLNLVGIFIVIGIGADDVFVFIDAWRQAEVMMPGLQPDELHKRLAWTLQRAGGAMFVTSMTTSCAFFAGAVSNITSLRCFGIYTGLVVICDFFLMITYLPAVVMIDHIYIKPRVQNFSFFTKACSSLPLCNKCCGSNEESKEAELGPGERAFRDVISPALTKGRWLWIVILGAVGCGLGWKAQFLEKVSGAEQQLKQQQ